MLSEAWKKRILALSILWISVLPFFSLKGALALDSLNDDAFISMTFVKNLVAGKGWVFNHSPPMLGTTTPLFVMLVTLLKLVFPWVKIPSLAILLSFVSYLGVFYLIVLFREWLGLSLLRCAAFLLLFSNPFCVQFYFWGMEPCTFFFLALLALAFLGTKRPFMAGVASGLLFLTRGEGALFLPLFLMWVLICPTSEDRGRTVGAGKLLAGFFTVLFPWCLFALSYFGGVLPTTLEAKMVQGEEYPPYQVWQCITRGNFPTFKNAERWEPMGHKYVWAFLVIIGLLKSWRESKERMILILWAILFIGGYSLLKVPYFWWYQIPVLFIFQFFAAFGGLAVLSRIRSQLPGNKGTWVTSVALITLLALLNISPVYGWRACGRFFIDIRAQAYLPICVWLQEHSLPTHTVAVREIGFFGYYTENRILDLQGITTPELLPFIKRKARPEWFWQAKPDFILFQTGMPQDMENFAKSSRFREEYQLRFELSDWDGMPMHLYSKKELNFFRSSSP